MTDARGGEMNRIRLMPDYDALLVPKQIAIITESVQALNDICVSLETENAAIRTAAEALVAALTQESDDYDGLVYYEYAKELADLQTALSRGWLSRSKAALEGK